MEQQYTDRRSGLEIHRGKFETRLLHPIHDSAAGRHTGTHTLGLTIPGWHSSKWNAIVGGLQRRVDPALSEGMAEEGGDLVKALAALRADLQAAVAEGRGSDVQFGLGEPSGEPSAVDSGPQQA